METASSREVEREAELPARPHDSRNFVARFISWLFLSLWLLVLSILQRTACFFLRILLRVLLSPLLLLRFISYSGLRLLEDALITHVITPLSTLLSSVSHMLNIPQWASDIASSITSSLSRLASRYAIGLVWVFILPLLYFCLSFLLIFFIHSFFFSLLVFRAPQPIYPALSESGATVILEPVPYHSLIPGTTYCAILELNAPSPVTQSTVTSTHLRTTENRTHLHTKRKHPPPTHFPLNLFLAQTEWELIEWTERTQTPTLALEVVLRDEFTYFQVTALRIEKCAKESMMGGLLRVAGEWRFTADAAIAAATALVLYVSTMSAYITSVLFGVVKNKDERAVRVEPREVVEEEVVRVSERENPLESELRNRRAFRNRE